MTAVPQPAGFPRRGTLAEYFALDAASPGEKYEYRDGTIVCMPGGTPPHAAITMKVGAALVSRLKGGPCEVYSGDLKIGVARRTYYMHPDVSVVCGPLQMDPRDTTGQTVLNAKLIVEVLSPSTERHDRREKFSRYMEIETFGEYVLVSQDRPWVESLFRQPDGTWSYSYANGLDATLHLRSLSIDLPLAEAYAGVQFPPTDAETPPVDSPP
jgi:Uma2 family endonuclease